MVPMDFLPKIIIVMMIIAMVILFGIFNSFEIDNRFYYMVFFLPSSGCRVQRPARRSGYCDLHPGLTDILHDCVFLTLLIQTKCVLKVEEN